MLRKSILALSIGLAAVGAHAQQMYVGASVGQVNHDDGGGIDVDDTTGFSLLAGYQVSANFAIEAAYVDFGSADVEGGGVTGEVEADTFSLSARLIAPLSEQASVYARLGMHKWDGEVIVHGFGSASDDGSDMLFGAGFSFSAAHNIELGLEFTKYDDVEIDTISAGARLSF